MTTAEPLEAIPLGRRLGLPAIEAGRDDALEFGIVVKSLFVHCSLLSNWPRRQGRASHTSPRRRGSHAMLSPGRRGVSAVSCHDPSWRREVWAPWHRGHGGGFPNEDPPFL